MPRLRLTWIFIWLLIALCSRLPRSVGLWADEVLTARARAGAAVTVPWHLDRIDQRSVPVDGIVATDGLGCGVTVYVVDSGVRITHEVFGGRAAHAAVGQGGDLVGDELGEVSGADDCHGHGTHTAALAAGYGFGVAPCAEVRAVRVSGCRGQGAPALAVRAVDWLTEHASRPAVVLMSLGYKHDASVRAAVARSVAAGLPYVVSAGDDFEDACAASPAGAAGAITVAGTTREDEPLTFGNFGPCVDLFAPGRSVLSADIGSDTATVRRSGASPAAALVAGAAALVLEQYPDATPCDVKSALIEAATVDAVELIERAIDTHTPNRFLYIGAFEGGGGEKW
jgi:subtilisin family serine protease